MARHVSDYEVAAAALAIAIQVLGVLDQLVGGEPRPLDAGDRADLDREPVEQQLLWVDRRDGHSGIGAGRQRREVNAPQRAPRRWREAATIERARHLGAQHLGRCLGRDDLSEPEGVRAIGTRDRHDPLQ